VWLLAPLTAGAYALSFSWGRWGDVVIDWGRELEIARRLAAGDVLYASVRYWYGPLAPYVNALLFAVFGVHTSVLQAAGLCSAGLMATLLWALAWRTAGAPAAATVTTAFVSLCAFGHYYVSDIFNWVTPYAYPATYGMVLATASLYALVRALEAEGSRWFTASLVLLALTLVTKLEPAFAALLAHAAFVVVSIRLGTRRPGRLIGAYVCVLAATLAAGGGFVVRTGTASLDASLLSLANPRTAVPIARYMGWSEWQTALPAVAISTLRLGACLAAPLLGVAGAVVVPVIAFVGVPPEMALRGLPVLALLGFGETLRRLGRRTGDERAAAVDLVLWAFAIGALARLPLTAGAHHYGFYLLPVPLAVVLLLWFRRLPALLGGTPAVTRLCGSAAIAMVATLAWTHLTASAAMYHQHTVHVVTPRGDLRLLDGVVGGISVGQVYAATVERLRAYPPDTTVFAAPEGAGLAFLAGLPSWGRDLSYYPPATGPDDDARLRAALEEDPPGLAMFLNVIDLRHYGAQGFGRDYATHSTAWLQQRYESDRVLSGNTVVIARPRGSTPPSP
jgi:hypothetical protein